MEVNNGNSFSEDTLNVLERVKGYKESIINEKVIGYTDMVRGITIFEEVLKDINPDAIDDDVVRTVEVKTYDIVTEMEDRAQHINSDLHRGLYHCLLILDVYNNLQKTEKYEKRRQLLRDRK